MLPTDNGSSHLYGMISQNRDKALSVGSTTDNLPEGSVNLYFTAARARSVYTVQAPLSYNQSLGTLTLPVATATADGYLSNSDWQTFNNKANSFSGYTGSFQVLSDVDLIAQTKVFKTLTYTNGVLTGVS